MPVDLDDERLRAQPDVAVGVGPVGHEPRVALHVGLGRVGKEQPGRDVDLVLDDARDRRRTHRPPLRRR